MDLKGANKYKANTNHSLNSDNITTLMVFYLPCISKSAISLYLLLSSEANKRSREMTIERLCLFLDIGIEKFSQSLTMLEQFKLVRTYYNQEEDTVRFDLQLPLSNEKFLEHEVFGRIYLKAVGKKQFELSRELYFNQIQVTGNDMEITSGFDFSMLNSRWSLDDETEYKKYTSSSYSNVKEDFDITAFLRGYSTLLMPTQFRTKENLQTIAKMATAYSIDIPTMRFYVTDAINIDTGEFDVDALRKMCVNSRKIGVNKNTDGYNVPVVQFLFTLQHGVPVSVSDKKSLEYLQLELNLPKEVINCLVEYVYNKENSYNRNYIEKIATSWAINKIDTLEKAQSQLETMNRTGRRPTTTFTNQNEDVYPQQDYQQIMDTLFKKGN